MNLLSSNRPLPRAVGGTGAATHSSIGVPRAPKPLNRSFGVLASMSVVGASAWLSTELGIHIGNANAAAKRTSAKTFMSFNIFLSSLGSLTYFVGQERRICALANSALFLLTAGNPLVPLVFARAGRNEVGGTCFHYDQTEDCELPREIASGGRASPTTLSKNQVPGQELECREQKMSGANEVGAIYYYSL